MSTGKEQLTEILKTQVVLPVGGEGKRMGLNIPKMLIGLGEDTLLDRCVKMFTDCGFNNFVFLLGYNDEKVTEHIDKNKWKNVSVTKCYDYAPSIAKGKAIKNAILSGKIDNTKRSIMCWPDDLFFDIRLPEKAIKEHLRAVKEHGTIASVVVVKEYRSPFGVVRINDNGIVAKFEEKPLVPLPTHVGMDIFEPEAYKYFIDMIDLKKEGPVEFENTVLPELAKGQKVYAIVIPPDTWLAVNTQKELEQAKKLVESGVLPKA